MITCGAGLDNVDLFDADTSRALYQILTRKARQGQSHVYNWPSPHAPDPVQSMEQLEKLWPALWKRLVRRMNEASGPYQMSCMAFVDVMLFDVQHKRVVYTQDVPHDIALVDLKSFPRVLWGYRYGKVNAFDAASIGTQAHGPVANFLHPTLIYVPAGAMTTHWSQIQKGYSQRQQGITERRII
eukprot:SAG31_NODE_13929_length_837_cov_0.979675_1_plen_183_part_10